MQNDASPMQPPSPMSRVRFVMERSFAALTDDAKQDFIKDLSQLTGCPEAEIRDIAWRMGCVVFEAEMDAAAIARLVDLWKRRNEDRERSPEEIKDAIFDQLDEMFEFLAKHAVTRITDASDFRINVNVIPKKHFSEQKHIVLVHGWTGDENTFGELGTFLSKAFNCPASVYKYPTGWVSHSPSTIFVAKNLDNWIRNYAHAAQLALVAHSMGGLIVRRLLVMQRDANSMIDQRVKQVTFLASPHHGAAIATMAKKLPALSSDQLSELSGNSAVLVDLQTQWVRWMERMVPKHCRIGNIYGTADTIVPVASAFGSDPEAVPLLGLGHMDVPKAKQATDEIVVTIARFFKEAGFTPAEETTQATTKVS